MQEQSTSSNPSLNSAGFSFFQDSSLITQLPQPAGGNGVAPLLLARTEKTLPKWTGSAKT